ncbi:MAG: helix-turn-helix transcriptional regulator [Sporichthyaceae bacterium]|nr:helix-turn-helix transcriptional regulator [Sporichthyaceae bacterium]
MTVIVGVDGAGRTHRLDELATAAPGKSVRVSAAVPTAELVARLESAAAGSLVLVDDAHRLDAERLRILVAAARAGQPMAIARRPTLATPELAELDEAVARSGSVEQLVPLDAAAVAGLVRTVLGKPGSAEVVDAVLTGSAGLPAIAAAIATAVAVGPASPVSQVLVARIQRRLAMVDPAVGRLARVQALRLELTDDVLAAAAGLTVAELAAHQRELRDAGLLVPGGEQLVPAVAEAILAELPPAERRRTHDAVANALLAGGADSLVAAEQLRAAGARTAVAGQLYRAAGATVRFIDPEAALAWFEDAVDAGADPVDLLADRAEAAALAGMRVELDGPARGGADLARLALVAGAVAAHDGRADRASQELLDAGPPGPLLAVPALVGTGRAEQAGAIVGKGTDPDAGPLALRRLAGAVLAGLDPVAAVPLLIEAVDAAEHGPPAVVLPDTAHALGAVIAVTAGDASTAEHLLTRALATGAGGPAGADRHRLLLAWVRMRAGRYDTAQAELRRVAGQPLSGRDRILAAAIAAGIARRSGDIARLRDTWSGVEQVLARRTVELFQLEAVEELVVAAARLRQRQRIAPVLDQLAAIVDQLGRPPAWSVTLGWVTFAVALAGADDTAAVNEPAIAAASELAQLAGLEAAGARQQAQCQAAGCWVEVLRGHIDADAVLAATEALLAAQLPWEASRLAGQAAIRTADPATARRLLERARELSVAEPMPDARAEIAAAGLSEREVEVAKLVLAGRTHKEIGAQLYIAPKTVEHHVARIRTKLGAGSRAEFVAALRAALAADQPGEL